MSSIEYTVAAGDTLFHIGKHHGINWRFIGHFNNLEELHIVHPGQKINIPSSTTALSELVDSLNTWYETRDKSDVAAVSVELESFARDSAVDQKRLHKWAADTHLPQAEQIVWEYYSAGKLTTLSWFVGEFAGEWRKYLSPDTK